jgi:DNA-binding NtrC family response regulator
LNTRPTKKILYLEDSELYVQLVKDLLSTDLDRDWTCTWVHNLQDAKAHLNTANFDIFLLDLGLAGTNGLETIESMQKFFSTVPSLIFTSHKANALALEAIRQGAQDYLLKSGLEAEAFIRACYHAMERFSLRKQLDGQLRKLRLKQEELNLILESTDEAIALFGPNHLLIYCNELFRQCFGKVESATWSELELELEFESKPDGLDDHPQGPARVTHPQSNNTFHFRRKEIVMDDVHKGNLIILKNLHQEIEIQSLNKNLVNLKKQLHAQGGFESIIGDSPAIRQLFDQLRVAARSELTILIQGESGTGKELVARAVHLNSLRENGPFIPINCAALPENLIESELFGHRKGAFTGAHQDREGLFEQASGGTLFLDEIGEMPATLQAKLLRTLQERRIRRIGDQKEIPIDVRVLAATNVNIDENIKKGSFREDLYYRLAEFPVHLPPLRERGNDVITIATYILSKNLPLQRTMPFKLSHDAVRAMLQYPWPGNVRELENRLKRAVLLESGEELSCATLGLSQGSDVSATLLSPHPSSLEVPQAPPLIGAFVQLEQPQPLSDIEQLVILKTLEHTKQNVTQAANILGINRVTLYRKLRNYGETCP